MTQIPSKATAQMIRSSVTSLARTWLKQLKTKKQTQMKPRRRQHPDTFKPYEDEPIASEEWVSEYEKRQETQAEFWKEA